MKKISIDKTKAREDNNVIFKELYLDMKEDEFDKYRKEYNDMIYKIIGRLKR